MAAVLACGDGAALSHESAAALWGIRKGGLHPIDVSVPKNRHIGLPGIRPHRRNPMPPATTIGAIPLSQPLFTLVDLAATLESDPLEAAINEADKLDLVDPEALEAALEHIPRYPGKGRLKATLARYSRTDSNLERRFLAIVRKALATARGPAPGPRLTRPAAVRQPADPRDARRGRRDASGYGNKARNVSSSMISVPAFSAFASFVPGSAPSSR
jgi:hypothetical protein